MLDRRERRERTSPGVPSCANSGATTTRRAHGGSTGERWATFSSALPRVRYGGAMDGGMDTRHLIDLIMQQTTVLIATVSPY